MTSSITSLIFEGAAMSHPFQIDNSRMIGEGVKLELISCNYGTLKKKHALVYDLYYVFLFIPLQLNIMVYFQKIKVARRGQKVPTIKHNQRR